jgi:hypothetical protein
VYALWTRLFFCEREPSTPLMAWRWFWARQLPGILRSITRRPGHVPLDLLLAELLGCVVGPWAYLKSRRQLTVEARK